MTERTVGPRVLYDRAVDALAVELVPDGAHVRTVRVGPDVLAHFDGGGRLVELECLRASALYTPAELTQLTSADEWLTLKAAATAYGLAATTLRLQIRNRRLPARKVGRDWLVTRAAMETYLEARRPAGRPARDGRAQRPRRAARPA